jgi:SAM-dependent methyltransferase
VSEDPSAWFERLYAAAATGDATVPWDREVPGGVLLAWAQERALEGRGRRAVVIGSAGGADAEFVSRLGFETVAFDIAPTAIKLARSRYPDTRVEYVVADLFEPPREWLEAFDLVVESINVQALPIPLHRRAIESVGRLVAPGGTLIVNSAKRDEADGPPDGPPWPLTRAEVESFAQGGLERVAIELVEDPRQPGQTRWRAEFRRPGT